VAQRHDDLQIVHALEALHRQQVVVAVPDDPLG
jgi:hypothetical protein